MKDVFVETFVSRAREYRIICPNLEPWVRFILCLQDALSKCDAVDRSFFFDQLDKTRERMKDEIFEDINDFNDFMVMKAYEN